MLIGKSIHTSIENDPSTSVSALIAHVKSIDEHTITYQKAWLVKKKVIENIYDNWKKSFHDLPRLLQAMQEFLPGLVIEKETLSMFPKRKSNSIWFCEIPSFFRPCIDGFQYCKLVVQVDKTWLYKK